MEIYEDIYESLSEEQFKIIEKINDNKKLNLIKKENDIKLNKLKLLLYQKFINILFSVISINIRKNLKIFVENFRFYKLKSLGYKLDSEVNIHKKEIQIS